MATSRWTAGPGSWIRSLIPTPPGFAPDRVTDRRNWAHLVDDHAQALVDFALPFVGDRDMAEVVAGRALVQHALLVHRKARPDETRHSLILAVEALCPAAAASPDAGSEVAGTYSEAVDGRSPGSVAGRLRDTPNLFAVAPEVSATTISDDDIEQGPCWRQDYNLRAVIWEGLGLTLTEFCAAWANGDLDSIHGPEIMRLWELLAPVVLTPAVRAAPPVSSTLPHLRLVSEPRGAA